MSERASEWISEQVSGRVSGLSQGDWRLFPQPVQVASTAAHDIVPETAEHMTLYRKQRIQIYSAPDCIETLQYSIARYFLTTIITLTDQSCVTTCTIIILRPEMTLAGGQVVLTATN